VAYSGAHDATIASVVSGRVDAAALDITVWRKFVSENKVDTKAVDVFYTTPTYFNYNWSMHADSPAELRQRVAARPARARQRATPRARTSCSSQRAPRGYVHHHARQLQGPRSRRAAQRRPALKRHWRSHAPHAPAARHGPATRPAWPAGAASGKEHP
jgi:hypothetical protein